MNRILKCATCGKYTLQEQCCLLTSRVGPAKFSPQDKYAEYRRQVKEKSYREQGYL